VLRRRSAFGRSHLCVSLCTISTTLCTQLASDGPQCQFFGCCVGSCGNGEPTRSKQPRCEPEAACARWAFIFFFSASRLLGVGRLLTRFRQPKRVDEIKEFLLIARRKDVQQVKVKKNSGKGKKKAVTKFKVRCSK
jgi:hypothetical protein